MDSSFDFVVVGAGAAGLRAAIGLAEHGTVLCLTKRELTESNTQYAQGGIAVALAEGDSPALHLRDTLTAGAGLVDEAAARVLVNEGPDRVLELLDWGIAFDRDSNGHLAFAREGAHSTHRVLHADGDSTGREIRRTLLAHAQTLPRITFQAFSTVRDLLLHEGRVVGVELLREDGGITRVLARAVLLATGGAGMVFANTTNPSVATADGPAMAWRAGAELADMEFVQFHPTALYLPGAPRFLLSEALRGDGAYLRNEHGERFMMAEHTLAELAPRDVVARAIHRQLERSEQPDPAVYLDVTHLDGEGFRHRFPTIYQTCLRYGFDMTRQTIPIRPAAHYAMGGIRTNLHAQSSLPGLYAAGEAACTGVHGANRLASNSLLEALVFGARAAEAMSQELELTPESATSAPPATLSPGSGNAAALGRESSEILWSNVGIVRDRQRLEAAVARLQAIRRELPAPLDVACCEARNSCESGLAMAQAALAREESRGGHFRTDFPAQDNQHYRLHSIQHGDRIRFEETIG